MSGLVALALLIAPTAHAGTTYTLKPSYPDGRVVLSTTTIDSTTIQPGVSGKSVQTTVARQTTHATATGARLDVEIVDMKIAADGPGAEVDPTGAMAEALKGHTYTVVVGADGQIASVEGMDDVVARIVDSMGEGLPDGAREGLVAALQATTGDEAMTRNLRQGTLALPSGPVEVGATWSADFLMDLMFGMAIDMDYACRLAEVQGSMATVSCDLGGELKLDMDAMLAQVAKLVPGGDALPPELASTMAQQMASAIQLENVSGNETLIYDLDRQMVVSSHSEVRTAMLVQGQKAEQIAKTDVRNEVQ